jgi:hypothetical protein
MQIKNVPIAEDVSKNTPFVYFCDTHSFFTDNGENYYSNLRGLTAFLFDHPERIHNLVLVKYQKDKYVVMRLCDIIVHFIIWRANVIFSDPITEKDIYNVKTSDPNYIHINKIMDIITERLVEREGEVTDTICDCMSNIKNKLSELFRGYAAICCNTVSIYNIIQFKNRSKEFKSLLNTNLDESKSIKELENEVKNCEKRLERVIKEDPYNCFNPYLRSGRIKIGQLTRVLVAVGTRPDIDKTILPKPIKRGYIHGLQDASEYFMETITARDAMLTKVDSVPISGLLSREINRLTSSIYINYDGPKDCGTKHTLCYEVKNADYLEMILGKYYVEDGVLKTVSSSDTHLIGKIINLRSIICCASQDGVCPTCVGKTAKRLVGTRIGCLPPIKLANPISNKAMGAKHDQTTKSIEIVNEALIKYFHCDGADFYINPEYADSRQMYIVINQDDVEELIYSSNLDIEDDTIDTRVQLSYAAIRDKGNDYILENEGMRIALSDEIIAQKNTFIDDPDDLDHALIPISKLDPGSPIFSVILDTEEISKYLSQFIATVDRKSVSRFQSYDNLIEEMTRIVYEAGLKPGIIHFESIVNCMLRSTDDVTMRPDFTKDKVPYQILRISSSIEQKDLYTTLSFQGLRRLFKNPSIRRRMGISLYDKFYQISPLF